MIRLLPLLALLIAVVPLSCVHAADWLNWRKVGDAALTWGPFTVYTSQLRSPDGRYAGPDEDQALIITYQRNIERDYLVEATREQWQATGIMQREPQSEAWLHMLNQLWPDVSPGTQLAFVLNDKKGQFWYRASPAQKNFTPWGPFNHRPLANVFWLSGLTPARVIPNCDSN